MDWSLLGLWAIAKYIQSVSKCKSGPVQYWRIHIHTHEYQRIHREWIGLYCDCIRSVLKYIQSVSKNQVPNNADEYTSIRTNTSEYIVNGLVCIATVLVLRLYKVCTEIHTVSIQIQIRSRSILTNTVTYQCARILANTSWMDWSVLTPCNVCTEIHTVSIQIQIRSRSILTNTHPYARIPAWMDWSVLRLYCDCVEIHTVSIQIQIRTRSILTNTHPYARILENTSWMDWPVLALYNVCTEIHTVSIQKWTTWLIALARASRPSRCFPVRLPGLLCSIG